MSAVRQWLADATRSASARREAELERELARTEASREGWVDRAAMWAQATGRAMSERDAARDALRALRAAVDDLPTYVTIRPHHTPGAVLRAPHLQDSALAVAMRQATDLLKELER